MGNTIKLDETSKLVLVYVIIKNKHASLSVGRAGAAVVQVMQEFIRCCCEYRIYQKVQIGTEADNLVKLFYVK